MSTHKEDLKTWDDDHYNPKAKLNGVRKDNEAWRWDMVLDNREGRIFAGALTILAGALVFIFAQG